jgi:hypothetical protein
VRVERLGVSHLQKHVAKAGGLKGSPESVTVSVYREDAPQAMLAEIPARDIARIGLTDVYQVDLYRTTVSARLELPAPGQTARSYTLLWCDDGGNRAITTETIYPPPPPAPRLRPTTPTSHREHYKLFVFGRDVRTDIQIEQARRRLRSSLGYDPTLEVIDIAENPDAAIASQVFVTPALVRVRETYK